MDRAFFLTTDRIGFSVWQPDDMNLAEALWGNPDVTKFICASGIFSKEDIANRLAQEVARQEEQRMQYWPIFDLASKALVGCCGLRPYQDGMYEIGFHLRPAFWRQGYAVEAAKAVIDYAFSVLHAEGLFAGHNPNNIASKKVLAKLGFQYIGDEFYPPTGLYHPSYMLKRR